MGVGGRIVMITRGRANGTLLVAQALLGRG